MTPARGVVAGIERAVAKALDRTKPVADALVLSRNSDGTINTQRFDRGADCVERGCVTADGVGAVIQARPRCQSSIGASGATVVSLAGSAGLLRISGIDPDSFERGTSLTVTVSGLGFREETSIDFLLPESEEINPGISIVDTRLVDSAALEVDIEVAEDAEVLDGGLIAYAHGASS